MVKITVNQFLTRTLKIANNLNSVNVSTVYINTVWCLTNIKLNASHNGIIYSMVSGNLYMEVHYHIINNSSNCMQIACKL